MLDPNVTCNRRYFGAWIHHSLCTESTAPKLVLQFAYVLLIDDDDDDDDGDNDDDDNNNNNNRIYITTYGRNFIGTGGRSDQCSAKALRPFDIKVSTFGRISHRGRGSPTGSVFCTLWI